MALTFMEGHEYLETINSNRVTDNMTIICKHGRKIMQYTAANMSAKAHKDTSESNPSSRKCLTKCLLKL